MNTGPALGKFSVLLAMLVLAVRSPCRAAEPLPAAVAAAQWSGDDFRNLTLRRHRTCVENEQYHHQGLCCLNCPAGTFVLRACERDHQQGVCSPCEHGHTYTEHPNGMNRCLPCTHCRQDEKETASCTTMSDTKCQCKPGTFCVSDQACEVCKRCAKCKSGEEEEKKCTHSSNTVCRKRHTSPTQIPSTQTTPTPAPVSPANIVVPILCCVFVVVPIVLAVWYFVIKPHFFQPCVKSHFEADEIVKVPIDESAPTAEECQNSRNAGLEGEDSRPESRPLLQETQAGMTKASSPVEDEDRGLGDSLPNTTSSSQTSLSALPTAASSGNSPQESPAACRVTPAAMEDPLQHRLIPLQESEKSLRKSFDLFDKHLDVGIHNKFFRNIGVSDNHIRMAEGGVAGDKVYELLKNWMQRQGLKADINQLLQALLDLDQRRSAESIASEALRRGFYKHAP
uniref:tumor necrosis factor receptor superfamily, member a isoform X2 n=1 Tax=Doryrhamphus excisus TaxID=161450 RepID=UPI0025AE2B35|nr:tumor necrosis factor receptor superfamily, member a isoform X2 [Doryrhamphus excisus]